MNGQECYTCKACGCGVALYSRNNQVYCLRCLPKEQQTPAPNTVDDQLLTLQQQSILNARAK